MPTIRRCELLPVGRQTVPTLFVDHTDEPRSTFTIFLLFTRQPTTGVNSIGELPGGLHGFQAPSTACVADGALAIATLDRQWNQPVLCLVMAAVHVPEPRLTITAIGVSPNFWFVLFGPILDARFSRRWYATLLAGLSGAAAAAAILSLHHLAMLQVAIVVCNAAAVLSSSASAAGF